MAMERSALGCIARGGYGCIGAWGQEAWRVTLLAAELDIVLDEDTLIYSDVYDLRSLRRRLQQALSRHGQHMGVWSKLRRFGHA